MDSFSRVLQGFPRRWAPVLLLFVVSPFAAGVSFVQANSNTAPTSTPPSISVGYLQAQTKGNLNVVVVGWNDTTSTIKSVTDSDSNAYVLAAGTNSVTGLSQAIYYSKNIAGDTGGNAVTVTFNSAPSNEDVRILEYSGLDAANPLDTSGGSFGSATTADSGSVTTNSANDLLIGAGTTSNRFSGAGAGYTPESFPGGYGDIVEDQVVAAAGPYNATATLTSGNWVMQIVAFRAAGQTPPTFSAPTVVSVSPNNGGDTGGTPIAITGTNFEPGATVVFSNGTQSASAINCSVASSTTINCTTPSFAAGSADLKVTNVDDQSFTLPGAYTFNAANPQIIGVTPANGGTNGGTTITITGSDFAAGAAVVVGGVLADNVSVQSLTTITCQVPAHASGPAYVEVVNPDGSSVTSTGAFTYATQPGIHFVQMNDNNGTSSLMVSYTLAQTAGDVNVVVIGWADTSTSVVKVTDSAGNTYQAALPPATTTGLSQTIWYANNIKSATANSNQVTVTFNSTPTSPDIRILEYGGIDSAAPIDNVAGNANQSTTADSGPLVTGNAADIIVAAATVQTKVAAAGPGFITVDVTKFFDNVEHQLTSAVGTYHATASVTLNSGSNPFWVMQAVAFKAASTPPPAPGFTLSASPSSASVNPGSSATYTLSVTPQNSFSAPVNLACSGPANVGISCSISPSSVTPNGGAAQATLTVATTGPTAALRTLRHNRTLLPLYAIWLPLPGIALAGVGLGSRRRKLGIGLTCFLLITLALLLVGCGGGGSSSGGGGGGGTGGTAAGTYNITVTATAASQAPQTTTVTLTVQ